MNVSVKQIVEKMDQELKLALTEDPAKVRDHLLVIRSLCDLVLQEPMKSTPKIDTSTPHSLLKEPKKNIQTDDEANGDSLFDF
ncbi:hypothetical protein JOC85_003205 [Bacillus mesophilus]|uniref:YwdI family protein n=1 Tax=Bacillus mesophilus TaxID=1808955 RepID=A0A6M0Q9I7_9BACI|nr:YwdI family protein [Bacillus mesophilus]MBM7662398.1 hypothetical protein [Bacillus mesophilus]NEY72975.1 YwdI family protein [Bacillus mesophilus]